MRKDIIGRKLKVFDSDQEIILRTKVPGKWLFVDTETGDVWRWKDGKFVRASDVDGDVLYEISGGERV